MTKPRVGIFGLAGCAGDQLVLLDCEEELLALADRLDLRDFLMASSENDEQTPLDVALVEGCVASHRDEERLRRLRERARVLVALGTCAVWGGVAAMANEDEEARRERLAAVYGSLGAAYDSLPPRALHEIVPIDICLPGCPVEKRELLSLLAHLLSGQVPPPVEWPVCADCRMAENRCLLQEGVLCCGPLTRGGCGARCPGLGVPCLGCHGPAEEADPSVSAALYIEKGVSLEDARAAVNLFCARAWQESTL